MNLEVLPHFVFKYEDATTNRNNFETVCAYEVPEFKCNPDAFIGTEYNKPFEGQYINGTLIHFGHNLAEAKEAMAGYVAEEAAKYVTHGVNMGAVGAAIDKVNQRMSTLDKTIKNFVIKFEMIESRLSAIERAVNTTNDYDQKIIPGLDTTVPMSIVSAAFQLEDVKTIKYLADHIPALRNLPPGCMWEAFPEDLKKNYIHLFNYIISEKFYMKNNYRMDEKDCLRDARALKSKFQKQVANGIRYSKQKSTKCSQQFGSSNNSIMSNTSHSSTEKGLFDSTNNIHDTTTIGHDSMMNSNSHHSMNDNSSHHSYHNM